MKNLTFVIGLIVCVSGFCSILAAAIWQQVLCYQMFGAIFDSVFIPHYSAFLYLGIIPATVGWIMMYYSYK